MQEIKFRIWSNEIKKWVTDLFLDNLLPNEYIRSCTINDIFNILQENKSIVIQQYTGIKDKFCHEVWQGDIVERENQWDENELGIVSCVDGVYIAIAKSRYRINHDILSSYNFKVVGNICENPELLESKKKI